MQAHPALFGVGGNYMGNIELENLRNEIIEDLVKIIGEVIPLEGYAIKGGYLLKKILNGCEKTANIKSTLDLDIDISCEEYQDMLFDALTEYLNKIQMEGKIYSYTLTKPGISKSGKPTAGRVRMYRKFDANCRKWLFCSLDFDVHPLFYGIVTYDGKPGYSIERIIADKFMAMYMSVERSVLHRSKDIVDLYLINQYIAERDYLLDYSIIVAVIRERLVRVYKTSVLPSMSAMEELILNVPQELYSAVRDCLESDRVNEELLDYSSVEEMVRKVLNMVNYIKGVYNNVIH